MGTPQIPSVDSDSKQFPTVIRTRLAANMGDVQQPEGAAVVQVLTATPSVAAAAAAAVQGKLSEQGVSYSLPYSVQPVFAAGTTRATGTGTVTFTTPAKFGTAFRGGRFDLPSVPTLRGSGKSFTLEMWINIPSPPTGGRAVVAAIGGDNCYLFADGSTGKLGWNFPGQTSPLSASTVCDGTWHHIALQWTEAASTTMSIDSMYVDGVASSGFPVQSTQNHDSRITIGGLGDTAGYDNPGATDEVRFSSSYRYAATFTPASAEFNWDTSSLGLAHLSGTTVQTGITNAYPPRPVAAVSGAVTYIGPTAPTDATTYDRWVKTA